MRLLALVLTATLLASPVGAQQAPAPSTADTPSPAQDEPKLPVSLSKIREALEATPLHPLRTLDETPTFRRSPPAPINALYFVIAAPTVCSVNGFRI